MEESSARLKAMAEVLQIMTRTSFELQAVLEAVVERASRLCRAQSGFIYRLAGDRYRLDVALNISDEFRSFTDGHPIMVGNRGTLTARVGEERRTTQIPDVLADPVLAASWHRIGYELGLGIGAALGYATLGRVGYEGHYQYNAIGYLVILASRLSGEAKSGEILITKRLHSAIEDVAIAGDARELTLKGFSRPVRVCNILGLKEATRD